MVRAVGSEGDRGERVISQVVVSGDGSGGRRARAKAPLMMDERVLVRVARLVGLRTAGRIKCCMVDSAVRVISERKEERRKDQRSKRTAMQQESTRITAWAVADEPAPDVGGKTG